MARKEETDTRRSAMLRTAFCPVVRSALDDPATIEIMANPDGSVWIETAGRGISSAPRALTWQDRERVIRLVASSTGDRIDPYAPIVSAELPGGGERF